MQVGLHGTGFYRRCKWVCTPTQPEAQQSSDPGGPPQGRMSVNISSDRLGPA